MPICRLYDSAARSCASSLGEVGLGLPVEGLFRVRRVDRVVEQPGREVAPYGSGGSLPALGRADDPPDQGDRVPPFQDYPDARPAADERYEVPEEGLILVHDVELCRLGL